MGTDGWMDQIWRQIIEFGIKPMGSEKIYRTGTYLKEIMEEIGLDAEICEYPETCREPASWELTDERGQSIDSYPFLDSGESPGFEGTVKEAGVHRVWDMYVWKRYMILGDAGDIRAYVTVRGNGGAIPQMLFARGELPHFLVGAKEEERLRKAAEEGGRLRGFVTVREPEHPVCRNVTGYMGEGDSKVILCAHYDTVYSTCGAYDNAAGAAVVLETARRLRKCRLHSRVQVLLTDGEEYNLRGSRRQAAADRDQIRFVLNIDGVGREDVLEVWSGPETFERKLRRILDQSRENFRAEYVCPPPPGSDHAPYYEKGADVCMLTFNDQGILHTPEDIYEKSKLRNMEKMVNIVMEVLEGLRVIEKS